MACIELMDITEKMEGHPIVGDPWYYTSGLLEMMDILLKPIVKFVPYLLRDSFDLLDKIEKEAENTVLLSTCIKSLHTNIDHDLA